MSRTTTALASFLIGTSLVGMSLVGCADAPGGESSSPRDAIADVLDDAAARAALQAHLREHGPRSQLTGSQLREILEAAEVATLEAANADDVDLDEVLLVAPNGLDAAMFERAPLVAYVDHADAREIAYASASREIVRTLPAVPSEPFVVVRPREVTIAHPIVAPKSDVAEITGSVYLRAIDLGGDWDTGSDEEIYTRCREFSTWDRTDIEAANDGWHTTWLWSERIYSISKGNSTIVCEVKEDDGLSGDDYIGSFAFTAVSLDATDHDTCDWHWFASGSHAAISRSRGYDQCPELNVLGMHCAQRCTEADD